MHAVHLQLTIDCHAWRSSLCRLMERQNTGHNFDTLVPYSCMQRSVAIQPIQTPAPVARDASHAPGHSRRATEAVSSALWSRACACAAATSKAAERGFRGPEAAQHPLCTVLKDHALQSART
jgi:hypothetical protein